MKKALIAFVATLLSCLFLVAFVGCSDNISSIVDIERYADMQQRADKIDVDFENGTQNGFQFTIIDEDEIEEIMNIIFSETLSKYADDMLPPGFNTIITIYQGEKSYTVNVSFISANGKLYSFSTTNLKDKITALATAAGAFENEKKDDTTDRVIIELSAEVKQEIIAAFVAKHSGDRYPVSEDEVFLRCYGAFDDVYVLFVDVVGWDYNTSIERDVVADVEFIYGSSHKMTVYSAGEFYSLSSAYENNIISRDNLLSVQRNYNGAHA